MLYLKTCFIRRFASPVLIDKDNGVVAGHAHQLAAATLEGSNVNPVDSMVSMISLARQFETQIKMLQTADANANKASQILSMN